VPRRVDGHRLQLDRPVRVVDGENDAERIAVGPIERKQRAGLVVAEHLIGRVVGEFEERQVGITLWANRDCPHRRVTHQIFLSCIVVTGRAVAVLVVPR